MSLALALGRRGLGRTWPNPAVGALVVKEGLIVGRGWTQPGGRPHAETEALGRAGTACRGATLYVSLEPCSHHGRTPPCVDAIIAAGVARVVSPMSDPNPSVAGQGHWKLAEAGVEVEVGIGAEAAHRAHAGHIRRMRDGRPHIMLKLALSADGKVALSGRRPVSITGEATRRRVHLMRAMSDAVATGIGTILADDPQLTCRLPGMNSPVRIVFDSRLRLPLGSRLVASAPTSPLWVVTAKEAPQALELELKTRGVEVIRVQAAEGSLDLPGSLRLFAERGLTRVLIEAGPILATELLQADLVDEAMLFRSPNLIGPDGIDALEGLQLSALTKSPRLQRIDEEKIGIDSLEIFARPVS